ncbi:MAG: SDR family NAD(P)-dependent oxidoreductase [Bacteroidetes bacterium]|nr:SDR family NAD(P)-dependent oxidoreductase [Bacteroidota bacterium]
MNIIVTGAGKGIGYEIVKILSKHKQNHILAISRKMNDLKELLSDCRKQTPEAKITPYEFDLNQFDFYPFIAQRMETILHKIDIIIHNAGRLVNKPFSKIEQGDFDEVFNVNVKAPFFFTQAMLPLMNRGGHIVMIGSLGGVQGTRKFEGLSAYSSSKAALTVLSECLAWELSGQDIHVNCLALGGAQTKMFEKAFPGVKAPQSAQQIASFIADFAVTGHKHFNGKVLEVAMAGT